MGIDMSAYKMIYKDQVYNVVGVMPTIDMTNNIAGEHTTKINSIQATYIDEDGELKILYDETFMFKFVRR